MGYSIHSATTLSGPGSPNTSRSDAEHLSGKASYNSHSTAASSIAYMQEYS